MNQYVFTEFAPLEKIDDALVSKLLLLQPWTWNKKANTAKITQLLKKDYLQMPSEMQMSTVFFHTGRSALYHFIKVQNLDKNSVIAVQAFTCSVVILPMLQLGLQPSYIDVEKQTFSMDIESLKQKYTPGMKILILQHSFGMIPKCRREILAFAKEKNILVIEDMAHGVDPHLWEESDEYKPQNMLLSFGRSKSISSVFGGAFITKNTEIAQQLQNISDHLPFPDAIHTFRILLYKPISIFIHTTYSIGIGKIIHKLCSLLGLLDKELSETEIQGTFDVAHDKTFPEWSAKLLIHQLQKYEKNQKQRNIIFEIYKKAFPSLQKPYSSRCPVLVSDISGARAAAAARNIFLGTWYTQPIDPRRTSLEKMKYQQGSCPQAEDICKHVVNVPLQISEETAITITNILKPFIA